MSLEAAASWQKFLVLPSGGSCAAQVQEELVHRLTSRGHRRVTQPQDCDYYLVFCPISSRVGTDVSDAENNIPGDKPAVLLVLHHTFNPYYVFRPSKRLVQKENVVLTVDLLFHQGALLSCPQNQQAWSTVEQFIWGPGSGRKSMKKILRSVFLVSSMAAILGLSVYLIYSIIELKRAP